MVCKIAGIRSLPTRERGLKPRPAALGAERDVVAPHAGAWIETSGCASPPRRWRSLPTRERGLKRLHEPADAEPGPVAPHAGAWIETPWSVSVRQSAAGRSPRGSVD